MSLTFSSPQFPPKLNPISNYFHKKKREREKKRRNKSQIPSRVLHRGLWGVQKGVTRRVDECTAMFK